uniref:5-bromo-4-chloroindolyl phosphate hydrolysis protein n=1 Tax=Candidatus Kentrum sp. SD TaxID=2126332 RepID=A0A451BPM4_9GAMM|nr:MAG: hypothetical protein BECKSD772D_GA0070982_10978 [Candidatus Kentron sp. SD]
MNVLIFVALCLACAFLWAYTRGFQEATLFWGKRLGEGNELLPSTGMQDAITPPSQNTRNTVMFASFLALPIVGVHQLGWAIGLGAFFGSFIVSSIVRAFLPKADSTFFFQMILQGLANRRAKFAHHSDTLRVEATDAVLEMLKAAFTEANRTATANGSGDRELLEAQELVNKYGTILENGKNVTRSEADLPAPKQQIKDALVALARHAKASGASRESIEPLRVGYAYLADFVSAGDASLATSFENLAKVSADELNDTKLCELAEKIADSGECALDITRRTTEKFAQLTTEFDERIIKS